MRCERRIALLGFLGNNNRRAAALLTTKVAERFRRGAETPCSGFIGPHFRRRHLSHRTPGSSCRCRRGPQSGDQHKDFLERLSLHRDLGHSERDTAATTGHLGADLDRLSPEARLETRLRVRGRTKTNPLRVQGARSKTDKAILQGNYGS